MDLENFSNTELAEKVGRLEAIVAMRDKQIEIAEARLGAVQAENDRLAADVFLMTRERDEARKGWHDAEQAFTDLEGERDEAQRKADTFWSAAQRTAAERDKLQGDIVELETRLRFANNRVLIVEEQLRSALAALARLGEAIGKGGN